MTQVRSAQQRVVDELSSIDGVRAAFIVRRDGTSVPDLVVGEDEELLGALCGAIFATINRSMQRTGLGELDDLVLTSTEGSIQAIAAGEVVIVVLAERETNLGLIRLALKRTAVEVARWDDGSLHT
jgi:predicted regulator of Ras-like GTPase activity (Roadblock/LC7/MglB family)